MNLLLTVNHSFDALVPLCGEEPVSILPIAGKVLLEHVLESVVDIEAKQITIAASGNVVELRHLIADGERWGMTINIVSAKTNEAALDIYERCPSLHQDETMIVPCERIYISSFSAIVSALKSAGKSGGSVLSHETEVALLTVSADTSSVDKIDTPQLSVQKIHTPLDFHSASLAAMSGSLGPVKLRGKQAAVGLRQGYMTRFHPRCVLSGHVFVGNHCRVHSTCKITGPVVINHGASIDRMTTVENSVIMDNSIIGEHLNVINAIVSGNTIIRVDTGAVIDISDKFILSGRGDSFFKAYGSAPLNRITGLLLSIVLLPVLLFAIAMQCIKSPGNIFKRRTFVGNKVYPSTTERLKFDTFVIDDADSPLRYLPLLFSVVTGNINIFGVSPLTPEEFSVRMDGWQKVTEQAPVGLMGPTQLYVGMDASLDEKLLSDAMSSQSGIGVSGLLELIVKCVQFPFVKKLSSAT